MDINLELYKCFYYVATTLSFSEASRQLEGLQAQVDVKANTLMELEQRMGYLRQQVSTQLMSRYEQNLNYTSVSSAQLTTGGN